MAAGKADIYIEQRANFSMRLTLKDSNGNARDLTNRVFTGQIRAKVSDAFTVATFSFNTLDQTSPSTRGMVDVILLPADTAAIPLPPSYSSTRTITKFVYDIYSTSSPTDSVRELEGTASVSPGVTRAG